MRSLLLMSTLVIVAAASGARAEGILGDWARGDGGARVHIEPCGQALCAINTWIKDPASSEKVGDRLVMKVQPIGPSTMKGEAYDPQRNLTLAFQIDIASPRSMTTKGCVLGGIICKDMGWTRLN